MFSWAILALGFPPPLCDVCLASIEDDVNEEVDDDEEEEEVEFNEHVADLLLVV